MLTYIFKKQDKRVIFYIYTLKQIIKEQKE